MAALLLSACAPTRASGTTAAPVRIVRSTLLAPSDIGTGWVSVATDTAAVQACSSPPSTASIVGPDGVGVRLVGPGGSPELVEFAAASTSVANAYIVAVRRLQTQSSCSPKTMGRTTSSDFQQVLSLPHYGDVSVGMLLSNDNGGMLSQAGYVVIRRGHDLTVVGYMNPGALDTSSLEKYTAAALAKLHG